MPFEMVVPSLRTLHFGQKITVLLVSILTEFDLT